MHQGANVAVLIQNNDITAMTGGQTHAGTRETLSGAPSTPVDLPASGGRLGVRSVQVVDPYDYEACLAALRTALAFEGPAVVITDRPCMLFPRKIGGEAFTVDEELCNACQQCMKLGCPSLLHVEAEYKGRHKVAIDVETCTGCSLCAQLCKPGAIAKVEAGVAGARETPGR